MPWFRKKFRPESEQQVLKTCWAQVCDVCQCPEFGCCLWTVVKKGIEGPFSDYLSKIVKSVISCNIWGLSFHFGHGSTANFRPTISWFEAFQYSNGKKILLRRHWFCVWFPSGLYNIGPCPCATSNFLRDKTNATREIRWRPVGCLLSRHSYRLRDPRSHESQGFQNQNASPGLES